MILYEKKHRNIITINVEPYIEYDLLLSIIIVNIILNGMLVNITIRESLNSNVKIIIMLQ